MLTSMSTQFEQNPQRVLPQRRPFEHEIPECLEAHPATRAVGVGAEFLKE